jgi:hypothetical protein
MFKKKGITVGTLIRNIFCRPRNGRKSVTFHWDKLTVHLTPDGFVSETPTGISISIVSIDHIEGSEAESEDG